MAEEPPKADAPIVAVDPPRTDADVWDDRIKMVGAIILAIIIVGVMVYLTILGLGEVPVMGAFVLALDRVIRYFFSTGTGQ